MTDLRIAVMGAAGRMGREIIKAAHHAPGVTLSGGIEPKGSIALGQDLGLLAGLGKIGVQITDDALELAARSDAIIDFTSPKAAAEHAGIAANARIPIVIGTTGLKSEEEAAIKAAARHAPVVMAGNMSLGVNLLTALVEKVAKALDPEFDIEIVEMHHNRKVDAPSGTALMLGEAAARGRGVVLSEVADRGRDGETGARKRGNIGFASLRGGSVVGEHTVMFVSDVERIEITHRAVDRGIFARGAVRAAVWAVGRTPGLYGMRDVLGI